VVFTAQVDRKIHLGRVKVERGICVQFAFIQTMTSVATATVVSHWL